MSLLDAFLEIIHAPHPAARPGSVLLPSQVPHIKPVNYSLTTREDVVALQTHLSALGYLDPPADGNWGPTSKWALDAFCRDHQIPPTGGILTRVAADALAVATPLPLTPDMSMAGANLASRLSRAMLDKGYWIARHPSCVNIVYAEGMNPDGTLNDNKPDQFNDLRAVFQVGKDGVPVMLGKWEATTEPGRYWTEHRMNPEGAFHTALGQYKAHCLGTHHTHEAWVQCGDIAGYRDADNKMIRDLRHPVHGSDMGVNQHWGYDLPRGELRNSSAGCWVGRSTDGHREFMRITKRDARFAANPTYRIVTTLLGRGEVPA